ncbi:UDP-N-acetylglucosamine 2-epimerase (non-hydrolyzing) [Candidatus Gracilibacteria bacterium]|nr:UDP-N-acetylglucosamine 2-epimerase (non-hydrolyzing) [Candidatus Gracilibacteria bacterium]
MKKILTIVGTRPELIRMSEIIKLLDKHTQHIFVHTGQNFTKELHDNFFTDLNIRLPDYQFNQIGKNGLAFIGQMYLDVEKVIIKEKPDAILILGDTHSALSAYVGKMYGVPIFHMEAGNRCFDETVPEENNRKIIDSLSTYLLPYTQRSRENLLLEGYHPSKIIVTGNPISEVISKYTIIENISKEKYVLVTLHRHENLIDKNKLEEIFSALRKISEKQKVVLSLHPKLKNMLEKYDIKLGDYIEGHLPFTFSEFISLEKFATCVLSDSGTVPEECSIFKTPCILLRTSTERPELLENNSMVLSGTRYEEIVQAFEVAINTSIGEIPSDYKDLNVSEKILKNILRHI